MVARTRSLPTASSTRFDAVLSETAIINVARSPSVSVRPSRRIASTPLPGVFAAAATVRSSSNRRRPASTSRCSATRIAVLIVLAAGNRFAPPISHGCPVPTNRAATAISTPLPAPRTRSSTRDHPLTPASVRGSAKSTRGSMRPGSCRRSAPAHRPLDDARQHDHPTGEPSHS